MSAVPNGCRVAVFCKTITRSKPPPSATSEKLAVPERISLLVTVQSELLLDQDQVEVACADVPQSAKAHMNATGRNLLTP
jgi:hypothetical protein